MANVRLHRALLNTKPKYKYFQPRWSMLPYYCEDPFLFLYSIAFVFFLYCNCNCNFREFLFLLSLIPVIYHLSLIRFYYIVMTMPLEIGSLVSASTGRQDETNKTKHNNGPATDEPDLIEYCLLFFFDSSHPLLN